MLGGYFPLMDRERSQEAYVEVQGELLFGETVVADKWVYPNASWSLSVYSRIAHAQPWLCHFQFKMTCCWPHPIL